MKRAVIAVASVLILLITGIPARSAEPGMPEPPEKAPPKDECLLTARHCGNEVRSIQDKIDRLKEEIAKGTTVYTPEELNILKKKLEDVNRTLDFLLEK